MSVSKEELLHIANLADLNIEDSKVDEYLKNLDDILNYTKILDKAPVENCEESIGEKEIVNSFRKDEVKKFKDRDLMFKNAPEMEENMFKIPRVIQ